MGPPRYPLRSSVSYASFPTREWLPWNPVPPATDPEYEVWGKTYSVMESAQGYQAEGVASWYGAKFHGRRTSSGEVYDMYQLTAAHRSLPIPVFARVTNLRNGRSTIVKINDRGPFHAERLIDLSFAAAVKLDFHQAGTAPVHIEVLQQSSSEEPQQEPEQSYYLHAGQFGSEDQAQSALGRLASLGNSSVEIIALERGGFALRIGPLASKPELNRLQALLIAEHWIAHAGAGTLVFTFQRKLFVMRDLPRFGISNFPIVLLSQPIQYPCFLRPTCRPPPFC